MKASDSFSGHQKGQASNSWNYVANKQHELNRNQPVKIFTEAEIVKYQRSKEYCDLHQDTKNNCSCE